jgi:hypothetical protein
MCLECAQNVKEFGEFRKQYQELNIDLVQLLELFHMRNYDKDAVIGAYLTQGNYLLMVRKEQRELKYQLWSARELIASMQRLFDGHKDERQGRDYSRIKISMELEDIDKVLRDD